MNKEMFEARKEDFTNFFKKGLRDKQIAVKYTNVELVEFIRFLLDNTK